MTIVEFLCIIVSYFMIGLGALGICVVVGTVLSDAYQSFRFNSGKCRKCGHALSPFQDKFTPSCKGFECIECNYRTYVSYNNIFIDIVNS